MTGRKVVPRKAAAVLGVAAFAYFVLFPGDLETLLAPLRVLSDGLAPPVAQALSVSEAVSPWLYGVLVAAILARTATRIWGRPQAAA